MRRFRSERGGVLLDAVLAVGIILLAAYGLAHVGLTFSQVLHGARYFFSH